MVGKSWPDGGVHATVDLSSARTGMLECYSDRAAKFEQRGRVTRSSPWASAPPLKLMFVPRETLTFFIFFDKTLGDVSYCTGVTV